MNNLTEERLDLMDQLKNKEVDRALVVVVFQVEVGVEAGVEVEAEVEVEEAKMMALLLKPYL